ncbi:MAG: glutamate racemase [bacterium]|nr:glutamate racemase [bacterium]
MKELPIGIFDSGVGGLTVAAEVMKTLPAEDIIYFGDIARTPYGTKSLETVRRFSIEIADFLIKQRVKMIVVACNTASSLALATLKERFHLPIIGVLEPGVLKAIKSTKSKRIGVIGTQATISSNAYPQAIKTIAPDIQVLNQPCPLFVPLVEEGWLEHEVTKLVAKEYLTPLKENQIDTLILGCTHYPFLKGVIQVVMGNEVVLVDSAIEVAEEIKKVLSQNNGLRPQNSNPVYKFYVSDTSSKFAEVGKRLLGNEIQVVMQVNV